MYNLTYFFTAFSMIAALIFAIIRLIMMLWNYL